MRSYKQIRADIARLEREAAAVRKSESAAIVDRIRKLAEQYGLNATDIWSDDAAAASPKASQASRKTTAARKPVVKKAAATRSSRSGAGIAKYRDPDSGKTWTGFGRAPAWLAGAKNRDAFLIGATGTSTAPAKKAAAKKTAAKKVAAKKTAAKKAAPDNSVASSSADAAG